MNAKRLLGLILVLLLVAQFQVLVFADDMEIVGDTQEAINSENVLGQSLSADGEQTLPFGKQYNVNQNMDSDRYCKRSVHRFV